MERREFPCAYCPDERFGPIEEADRATQLYFRVVHYLSALPDSLGGYPWDMIFACAGVTDLEMMREVLERLSIAKQAQAEYDEKHRQKD